MHPNLMDVGELRLRRFPLSESYRQRCSCGELVGECPYWRSVETNFRSSLASFDAQKYQLRMNRYQRLRSVPRLMLASHHLSNDFSAYQQEAFELIKSATSASGKPAVVDISKIPFRALALATIPEIDLRLIHLVRNGLAQISSTQKHRGRKWTKQGSSARQISVISMNEWLFSNIGAEFSIKVSGRAAVRVRHEDLLKAPERLISSLSDIVGEDLSGIGQRVAAGELINFGHAAGGNIAGLAGPKPLITSEDWQDKVAPETQNLFRIRAGWLNHRYGY